MTSIKELRKQLAKERAKESKENAQRSMKQEKSSLKKQLFISKHRKSIKVIKIIGSGGARVGRGLGIVAKKGYDAMEKAEKQSKKKKKKGNSGYGLPDYSSFAGY